MNLPERYVLDKNLILQKSYNLLCIFFANKEIARRSDPKDKAAPLTSLESMFLARETSRLLIEVAASIRVLDDQMRNLPVTDNNRIQYEKRKAIVDNYEFALFDDLDLDLRETCNKIIHSNIMEPHTAEGYEAHKLDIAFSNGDGKKEIDWQHLNGYVRLCGTHKKVEWYVLLDIEAFVKGIYTLLNY